MLHDLPSSRYNAFLGLVVVGICIPWIWGVSCRPEINDPCTQKVYDKICTYTSRAGATGYCAMTDLWFAFEERARQDRTIDVRFAVTKMDAGDSSDNFGRGHI